MVGMEFGQGKYWNVTVKRCGMVKQRKKSKKGKELGYKKLNVLNFNERQPHTKTSLAKEINVPTGNHAYLFQNENLVQL
ncbi:Hypothetical predicted protein [Octopus vulgaris]|uniref:Uncharacterized protein n=1 Tax=Octopus vulgaris TaxID=6645 RepID=A0AA36B6Z0_OCTVU|nr:Hypothetical predicted protein [Octopus vulgaris]